MFKKNQRIEFIRTVIEKQYDKCPQQDFQNQILDKLYTETNDGKLYKYRTVNTHSISNLRDGTLYCAMPSSFNDPFDCKFGIELETLVPAKYGTVFEDACLCFKKYLSIYKGEASLEACTEREKKVIKQWSNNKKICGFIEKYIGEKDENLFVKVIQESIDIFFDIFTIYSMDDDFAKQIKYVEPMIDEMFNHMNEKQKLEMLKGDSSLNNFACGMGIKEDVDQITMISLLNQRLCPSQVENSELADKKLKDIYCNLAKIIDNTYRVGSLCADNKNNLMWSHYANGHRGFCIEYDFKSSCEAKKELCILPVVYSDERMRFPWKLVLDIQQRKSDINRETAYAVIEVLLTKDSMWSYENEWRIIILEKLGIKNVSMPPITCIYIGASCSEEDKALLRDIAKEKNIPIKQMVIDRSEYTLHAVEC